MRMVVEWDLRFVRPLSITSSRTNMGLTQHVKRLLECKAVSLRPRLSSSELEIVLMIILEKNTLASCQLLPFVDACQARIHGAIAVCIKRCSNKSLATLPSWFCFYCFQKLPKTRTFRRHRDIEFSGFIIYH